MTDTSTATNPKAARKRRLTGRTVLAGLAASLLALTGCSLGSANAGGAEDYPNRALEYIVPFAPGGSTDPVGREFSRMLAEELGTNETVQNMPGGDQAIGVTAVLDAEADGHTMGLSSPSGIIVQPMLNDSLPYQDASDYTPIAKMVTGPYALLVAKDSPYKTLDDFIAAAKENPGKLRVGTTARMSDNSFALFSLEEQADIKTTMVPFPGGAGESVLAVMGGEIEGIFATASGQLGLVESGDLRALAHTGRAEYNRFLPGAISFEEEGYDIPFASEFMTVAPAGIPDDIREKLVGAAEKVVASEEWAEWCEKQGILPDPIVGDELDTWIKETTERSEKAIAMAEAREG